MTLVCENCDDRDCTYIDHETKPWPLDENLQYICPKCKKLISLDYCRGHDMYFEVSCTYCDKLL